MTVRETIKGIINTLYMGIGTKKQTQHKVDLICEVIGKEIIGKDIKEEVGVDEAAQNALRQQQREKLK